MKIYIYIFILMLLPIVMKAQLSVGYTGFYGNYSQMGEMKDLLESKLSEVVKTIPNAAIVSEFPDYHAHKIDINYDLGREGYGFQIMYLSTGGKIAYSDYSGEYVNKLTLRAIRLGTHFRYNFKEFTFGKNQHIWLYGEISPGLTLSTLKNSVYEQYPTEKVDGKSDDNRTATGFSLLPLVGVKTNFGRLGVHLTAGYDLDLGGTAGGKTANDEEYKISWMGFRAGVGISYTFGKKKESIVKPEAK